MRIPVPTNKLVAFTLAGALLTALVGGALAFPGAVSQLGLSPLDEASSPAVPASTQVSTASSAPVPNPEFTPAVQTRVIVEQSAGDQSTAAPSGSTPAEPAAVAPPTPNPNFTPSVQTRAGSSGEHEDEYEEHDEEHDDDHDDDHEDDDDEEWD